MKGDEFPYICMNKEMYKGLGSKPQIGNKFITREEICKMKAESAVCTYNSCAVSQ